MIECLHCGNGFTPKNKKAIYCCDKCRNYANKEKKNLSVNNKMFFLDHNGIKRLLTKQTLLDLLKQFDGETPIQPTIKKVFDAPKIERKDDEFRIPAQPIEEVDYEKLFNDCEFPEERKNLWERIKLDGNMLEKERMQWKFRLNAK